MSARRNDAIDLLRGVVMVLMVLDHARDFWAGFGASPTDLSTTTPFLFFTRWITHFCAPVFVFLAGTAAYLWGSRHTPSERTRFLLSRGVWLVLLELTVVKLAWAPEPYWGFVLLQVIWAIGWAMIAMSALARLPVGAVLAVGAVIVLGHDALAPIDADDLGSLGWLWSFLFERGRWEPFEGHRAIVAYPVVPWLGVMALGYAFGRVAERPPEERRRLTLRLGAALTVGFVVLRASNLYGDSEPWTTQRDALWTLMSFLNCQKYPPSLCYLLMTLGPALMALAGFESLASRRGAAPIIVFGRVPLFYYVAHLYLLRITAGIAAYALFGAAAFAPPPGPAGSPGLGLGAVYVAWVVAVAVLYPACRWFAGVKRRRDDWWLKYL